jgi:hypothetical protein
MILFLDLKVTAAKYIEDEYTITDKETILQLKREISWLIDLNSLTNKHLDYETRA